MASLCYSGGVSTKTTNSAREAVPDSDADIDRFLVEHHADVAAKLAAARGQVAGGEAAPLEPLEELLREARARR